MKKLGYVLIIFVLLLQINVKADNSCTTKEKESLKYLADKIDFSYDYENVVFKTEKSGNMVYEYRKPIFKITAHNLNSDLKVLIEKDYLKGDYKEFKDDGTGKGSINGFEENETIYITIRAYANNDCIGNLITTKKIKLPFYNIKHFTDICQSYPEYENCAMFLENEISVDQFNEGLKKYISGVNNEKSQEENKSINQSGVKNDKFWIYSVGVIVIIVFIVLFVWRHKKKNNDI